VFGAEMLVELVNDGPVTIILDSQELARPRRQRNHVEEP
jgi:D-tyrosyl-tRNA(Tyr) deacylase